MEKGSGWNRLREPLISIGTGEVHFSVRHGGAVKEGLELTLAVLGVVGVDRTV